MLISTGGTVIRMPVDGIRRAGRLTQGVNVMTLREGELVSAIAPVAESATEGGDLEALVTPVETERLQAEP
jgi:DNA gyrase subunit A